MQTLQERKSEYDLHELAGKDYYNTFRAQLTLDIESNTKTLEESVEIHKRLKVVGEYLCTGDWKSAHLQLSNTLPNVFCTQEIIDTMLTDIGAYISNNYSW